MLKPKAIWQLIVDLSTEKEFFARLRKDLENDPDREAILEEWATYNFEDNMDFILRIEEAEE